MRELCGLEVLLAEVIELSRALESDGSELWVLFDLGCMRRQSSRVRIASPYWNESFEFSLDSGDDTKLQLYLYSSINCEDPIASAVVDCSNFLRGGRTPVTLDVVDGANVVIGALRLEFSPLFYTFPREALRALNITVIDAQGLELHHQLHKTKPVAEVNLCGTSVATTVRPSVHNVVWNETFRVMVGRTDKLELLLHLHNKKTRGEPVAVGQVNLGWFHLEPQATTEHQVALRKDGVLIGRLRIGVQAEFFLFNRDALREIQVKVVRTSPHDEMSESIPYTGYVGIKMDGIRKPDYTLYKPSNTTWNESFLYKVDPNNKLLCTFTLYKKWLMILSKSLGDHTFDLGELPLQQRDIEKAIPITYKHRLVANLHIRVLARFDGDQPFEAGASRGWYSGLWNGLSSVPGLRSFNAPATSYVPIEEDILPYATPPKYINPDQPRYSSRYMMSPTRLAGSPHPVFSTAGDYYTSRGRRLSHRPPPPPVIVEDSIVPYTASHPGTTIATNTYYVE